jgi:DNA-binding NarL/FixJ family response regulator
MCRRAVNGITANTLHEVVRIVRAGDGFGNIPAKMKPGFMMDFLKARSLSFQATRAQYPNYLKPWSKEDDRKVLELMNGGLSLKKVAERMGRNPGAIEARLAKLEELED